MKKFAFSILALFCIACEGLIEPKVFGSLQQFNSQFSNSPSNLRSQGVPVFFPTFAVSWASDSKGNRITCNASIFYEVKNADGEIILSRFSDMGGFGNNHPEGSERVLPLGKYSITFKNISTETNFVPVNLVFYDGNTSSTNDVFGMDYQKLLRPGNEVTFSIEIKNTSWYKMNCNTQWVSSTGFFTPRFPNDYLSTPTDYCQKLKPNLIGQELVWENEDNDPETNPTRLPNSIYLSVTEDGNTFKRIKNPFHIKRNFDKSIFEENKFNKPETSPIKILKGI